MKFRATVIPSGNATAVAVPKAVMEKLAAGARPAVSISINSHQWRSRIAAMHGLSLIGISAANRKAAGIAEGDTVEVLLELDTEPRVAEEPADLATALGKSKKARAGFDKLPFGLKRKHIAQIEEAKAPETRQRRIAKLISTLEENAG